MVPGNDWVRSLRDGDRDGNPGVDAWKKVCGGRVVRRSGGKSGVIGNIIRNGMKGLSLALLGLGQLWAFFDKDRRTLYDRLTGVMVIRTRRPSP